MAKLKGKARAKARKTKRNAFKQSKNCMVILPNGGFKMISEQELERLTSSSEML